MEKNSQDFSIEKARELAQSDAGRALYALLKKNNGPQLRQAMDQAAAGDMEQVKKTVESLLDSPDVQALIKQLGG